MSSDTAVKVTDLTKNYTISHRPNSGAGRLATAARSVLHPRAGRGRRETFVALEHVDFELKQGEVLGIIGRNGAGKSTLLKILTRITYPTAGRVDLWGRVGSLLEVGTGFQPELTGRENIYLNGATLGMTSREVKARFAEIVDFAGVEQFLDTPVKRYSSGMYVRLAFAVAAHLEADILLVDEVLAVGDAEFQERCLGKMRSVAGEGRTVILVSHQLQSVRALCSRALVLQAGRLSFDGGAEDAIQQHLASYEALEFIDTDPTSRPGHGGVRTRSVVADKSIFDSGEPKVFHFEFDATAYTGPRYYLGVHIVDEQGVELLQMDSRLDGWWGVAGALGTARLALNTPWLKPGRYRVDTNVCAPGIGILDEWEASSYFRVSPVLPYKAIGTEDGTARGVVFADFHVE